MSISTAQHNYENAFAEFFGAKSAFSFWKGRVALYATLKAMGIGEGDEVITPGYTCVMNVNPIKYLGATPVYIDIEPDTFNMDAGKIEKKITGSTRAIIAQHTYGYVCDMDTIMDIANRHNLPVIEDCCLTLGSTYKGRTAGTFGKAAYFSFQWNKPYTTGLGGMVITSDEYLAEKISSIQADCAAPSFKEALMLAAQLAVYRMFIYPRTTALAQNIFRFLTKKGLVVGSSSTAEFKPEMAADFLKSMSSVQVRSGIKQLKKLPSFIEHRKKMAGLYDTLLAEKGWKTRQYDPNLTDPVMVRYPVRINDKQRAVETAASAGIELGTWFECTLHPIETPLMPYDYQPGMCPQAEKASEQTVNLPLHPRAGEKTVRKSVEFITQFQQAE